MLFSQLKWQLLFKVSISKLAFYLTLCFHKLLDLPLIVAKPQVSLTAPNRDYFEQVSLTVLDFFGLIRKSIAQNLK